MTGSTLHHVGYVVASAEEGAKQFAESLGAELVSDVIYDPLQKVKVVFLRPPGGSPTLIELVAPEGTSSPVTAFLAKGGGLHHVCYEVDNLEDTLEEMRRRRAVVLRPPKPATAFHGRRIAWIITPERLLMELLERRSTGS